MLTRLKAAIGRHLPWWLVVVIGAGCVVLGGVLIADPFRSLRVLAWVVAAALVVTGLGELATARSSYRPWLSWLAGVVSIVCGIVAVAWPGLTVRALATVVGVALIVVGAIKVVSDGLCARGHDVALRIYPDAGHIATSNVAASDVAAWIADRFAGKPAPSTCS